MSGAIYDQLGESLKAQRERFGADAFENRRRVISLLADALPEARREIRALASALDEGAVEALSSVERRLLGMEMDRQADKLEQSVGLRPDLAKQIIRALAFALDLGPAPSVYEAAAPAPSAPAQDWAGMSQPNGLSPAFNATPSHGVLPSPGISPTHYPTQPAPPQQPASLQLGLDKVLFTFQGTPITRLHSVIAAGVVGLAVIALPMLGNGGQAPAQPHTLPDIQLSEAGYAGEMNDNGVQPKDTLESNVGSPTPMSVPGGQRVTTKQVVDIMRADANAILIDVLVDPHNVTAQGARYLPAAGQPGTFNDAAQAQTAQALRNLTGGRTDRPLVFFCAGAACWESYNAVLRARAAGYTRLYWYRGGLASWHAAGLPMQNLPPPST